MSAEDATAGLFHARCVPVTGMIPSGRESDWVGTPRWRGPSAKAIDTLHACSILCLYRNVLGKVKLRTYPVAGDVIGAA